jgi:TatD DNase family protein
LISISGSVSYEKNHKLRDVVKKIPIDFLLIETDCPDQVPVDWGTEIYTPMGVWNVAKYLSEIRSEKPEALLIKSSENLSKLLKLKEKGQSIT